MVHAPFVAPSFALPGGKIGRWYGTASLYRVFPAAEGGTTQMDWSVLGRNRLDTCGCRRIW